MTAMKKSKEEQPQPPSVTPQKGIELIEKQIKQGEELLTKEPLRSDSYTAWENITQACLEKAFGLFSPNVSKVMDIGKYGFFPGGAGEEYWENHRAKSLASQIAILRSHIEILKMEAELVNGNTITDDPIRSVLGKDIFLVHGHNDGIKESVARFLEKMELKPIILHEKPNGGRTIIEKFTDYASVGFSVVLMTADDIGGIAGSEHEKLSPRARQNVLFELGYFIGKLGRQRVCALYQEGVEIPSDYTGILFIKLDEAGAWKMQLAKEIKALGIDVDMNKAI